MPESTLGVEWKGTVAIVTMNDPATLNAMTVEMIDAFSHALDEIEARAGAMILTGAGAAFCSGANLGGGMGEQDDPAQSDAGRLLETHINPLMTRLRDLKVPWVAVVRGAAAGAGASLALAADLIVASETAYFLQAFSRIGLVPDGGSTHLLVRTIGRPRAMELMLLGERLPSAKALQWGLVNRVVPDDALDAEGLALAERLANGPQALKLIRQLAWTAVDADWTATLATERGLQLHAGRSTDHREGVAAFREKRPARFTGR